MMQNDRIEPNGLDVKVINPKKGEKYSPNLFRWLTHRDWKYRTWTSRIYKDTEGKLWIGILDEVFLSGCRLMGVLVRGGREGTAAYPVVNFGPFEEVKDFWQRYTEVGRCAIDVDHKMYFINDGRWIEGGNKKTRTCQWCGAKQTLMERKRTITETEWVMQPNLSLVRTQKAAPHS